MKCPHLDPRVVQRILDGQSFPVGGKASVHVSSCHKPPEARHLSPLVLLQQLADELLGQLAGVTEELLVKLVVYGGDVLQGVVFGLPQERRSPAQPGTRRTCQLVRTCRTRLMLVPETFPRKPEQDLSAAGSTLCGCESPQLESVGHFL